MPCSRATVLFALSLSLLALARGATAQVDRRPPLPAARFQAASYGTTQGLDMFLALSSGAATFAGLSIVGPDGAPFILMLGASQQNVPFEGITVLIGSVALAVPGVLSGGSSPLYPLAIPATLDPGVQVTAYAQAIGLHNNAYLASQGWLLRISSGGE